MMKLAAPRIFVVLLLTGCCEGYAAFCQIPELDCRRDVGKGNKVPEGTICVFDGSTGTFCAFRDDGCPSRYRWGHYTVPEIQCECVDPMLLSADGGT